MKDTMSLVTPVLVLALFLLSSTSVVSDYIGKCRSISKDKEMACSDICGEAEGDCYQLCLNTLRSRFNGSTFELAEYARAVAQQAKHSYRRTIIVATGELMFNSSLSGEERVAYIGCLNETTYRKAVNSMDRVIALLPKNGTGLDDNYSQAYIAVDRCIEAVTNLPLPSPLLNMISIDGCYTLVAWALYVDLVGGRYS
ncbi:hypothetical protein ACP4OV_018442 [Aristida adscensionis]